MHGRRAAHGAGTADIVALGLCPTTRGSGYHVCCRRPYYSDDQCWIDVLWPAPGGLSTKALGQALDPHTIMLERRELCSREISTRHSKSVDLSGAKAAAGDNYPVMMAIAFVAPLALCAVYGPPAANRVVTSPAMHVSGATSQRLDLHSGHPLAQS